MQYPVKSGPLPNNDQAPFSPEMVQGAIPVRARFAFKTQHLPPISQTTHVGAPDSMEMWMGQHPDAARIKLGVRIPLPYVDNPIAAPFSVEMSAGYHPDQPPRLQLGIRIPLPISQTTHDAAPFTVDMVQGWIPLRARPFIPAHMGWSIDDYTTVATVSVSSDMDAFMGVIHSNDSILDASIG